MKSAFTIIELIFVIVILGILAVVAIPRLSATREDAKIATLAKMIMSGSQEVVSYAVAHGETNDSFSNMSNNFDALEKSGIAVLASKKATVKCGNVSDCVIVEINTTATSEILQISQKASGGGDSSCISLQNIIKNGIYPIRLRGSSVVQ